MTDETPKEATPPSPASELTETLEDMLAPSKLGQDSELPKLMDAQMFIRFDKLKEKWFPDNTIEQLQEAVGNSSTLVMNSDKSAVKPALKAKRTVVIIREVPESVQVADLRKLLSGFVEKPDVLTHLKDLHRDDNAGMWFANFEEESDAMEVAIWLQRQKAPWGTGNVRCAMKSDHVVRSFFPANMIPPPVNFAPTPFLPSQFVMPHIFMGMMKGKGKGPDIPMMYDKGKMGMMKGKGKGIPLMNEKGKGKGKKSKSAPGPPSYPSMGMDPAFGSRGHEASSVSNDFFSLGERTSSNFDAQALKEVFHRGGALEVNDFVDSRYQGNFQKYSREEILDICDKMKTVEKPETFAVFEKENEHVKGLFTTEANQTWAKVNSSDLDMLPSVNPMAKSQPQKQSRRKKGESSDAEQVSKEDEAGQKEGLNDDPGSKKKKKKAASQDDTANNQNNPQGKKKKAKEQHYDEYADWGQGWEEGEWNSNNWATGGDYRKKKVSGGSGASREKYAGVSGGGGSGASGEKYAGGTSSNRGKWILKKAETTTSPTTANTATTAN